MAQNGVWENTGLNSPVYLGTLHKSSSAVELAFNFDGTGIRLLGYDSIGIDWDCGIDNLPIAPINAGNGRVLCEWQGGQPGNHTFTFKGIDGLIFWIDRIEYLPSLGAVGPTTSVVAVDHADTAISYEGQWNSLLRVGVAVVELCSRLEIEFTGTQLTWYGFLPPELAKGSAKATFTLDSGAPGITECLPPPGTPPNWVLFQTPRLDPGSLHHLVVTYEGNKRESSNSTPLTLARLLLEGGNFTSPPTHNLTPLEPPSPSSLQPSGPNSEKTGVVNDVHGNGPAVPGVIIGSALGGIVLIVEMGILFIFLRRRKSQQEESCVSPFLHPSRMPIARQSQYFRKEGLDAAEESEGRRQRESFRSDASTTVVSPGSTDRARNEPALSTEHQ